MNVAKTEYIVIGNNTQGGLITGNGHRILPQKSATYLGYQRKNNDTTITHLQKRITQAKKAAFNTHTLLQRVPDLPVNKQLQIANSCMRTVFLYGTEACLNEALEEFKHEMNVMMRKLARQILRTSYAPANQTIQLDLGWKTMKAEIEINRIKLGLKLLSTPKNGTIA